MRCVGCNGVFGAQHEAQKYCDDDCRRKQRNARKRAARKPKVRACACGASFNSTKHRKFYCSPECDARKCVKPCVICGVDFTPGQSAQTICSDVCRLERDARRNQARRAAGMVKAAKKALQGPTILRLTCQHCGTTFSMETTRRRKFCRPACRKAHHVAKFKDEPLDYEGEIPVAELDDAPRRLAVAKLFDRWECDGDFYHGPTSPTWINPSDRRAGR